MHVAFVCKPKHVYVCMHARIGTYIYACIYTCIHTHACLQLAIILEERIRIFRCIYLFCRVYIHRFLPSGSSFLLLCDVFKPQEDPSIGNTFSFYSRLLNHSTFIFCFICLGVSTLHFLKTIHSRANAPNSVRLSGVCTPQLHQLNLSLFVAPLPFPFVLIHLPWLQP